MPRVARTPAYHHSGLWHSELESGPSTGGPVWLQASMRLHKRDPEQETARAENIIPAEGQEHELGWQCAGSLGVFWLPSGEVSLRGGWPQQGTALLRSPARMLLPPTPPLPFQPLLSLCNEESSPSWSAEQKHQPTARHTARSHSKCAHLSTRVVGRRTLYPQGQAPGCLLNSSLEVNTTPSNPQCQPSLLGPAAGSRVPAPPLRPQARPSASSGWLPSC